MDDSESNLLAYSAILKKLGCPVLTTRSGPEALLLARTQDCAVILMDVRMPTWNGFETAQRLRQEDRARRTPILFMFAVEVPAMHLIQSFVGGDVDFIPSPVDTELLIRKVSSFLGSSSSEGPQDASDPRLEKAKRATDGSRTGQDRTADPRQKGDPEGLV